MKKILNILEAIGWTILTVFIFFYCSVDKYLFYYVVAVSLFCLSLILISYLLEYLLNKIQSDKTLVIATFLYIAYGLVIYQMLRHNSYEEFIIIYISLALIFLLFKEYIRYLFSIYQFSVFIFVSNIDWVKELFGYDYKNKRIFLLLILSSPTIAYVAYKYL